MCDEIFSAGGSVLLLDLASTILFLIVFSLTHNVRLAVGLGMALGLAQIGIQFARGRPIATMEWLSLFRSRASLAPTLFRHLRAYGGRVTLMRATS